jgi:hypothetical protein
MRGEDERSGSLFSYVDLEARVGRNHPLRTIRAIVNEALARLGGDFSALYSRMGRSSIPPEKLLRAMLLQAFYSIRSERESTHGHRPLRERTERAPEAVFAPTMSWPVSRLSSETIMTFGPRWNFVLTRRWRRLKVYSRRRCPSSLKSWRCGPCSLRLSLWRGLPSPRMPPPRAMK